MLEINKVFILNKYKLKIREKFVLKCWITLKTSLHNNINDDDDDEDV